MTNCDQCNRNLAQANEQHRLLMRKIKHYEEALREIATQTESRGLPSIARYVRSILGEPEPKPRGSKLHVNHCSVWTCGQCNCGAIKNE